MARAENSARGVVRFSSVRLIFHKNQHSPFPLLWGKGQGMGVLGATAAEVTVEAVPENRVISPALDPHPLPLPP